MKKTLTVMAMIALITGGALYAKPQMGPGQKGPGGQYHQKMGQKMHNRKSMLIKMAGLETVSQKYQIKIERLKLDHKEANLSLHEQKRKLHREIADLTSKYDANPKTVGKEIATKMKKLSQIEKKLSASRQANKAKIQSIRDQQRKELQAGVDKWITSLANNPEEMKKFVDMSQRMQKYHNNMSDCLQDKKGKSKKGKQYHK